MQKMTTMTPSIYEIIFQKFWSEILTILKVLDNPECPVHLELFRPFASEVFGLVYHVHCKHLYVGKMHENGSVYYCQRKWVGGQKKPSICQHMTVAANFRAKK